MCLCMCGVLWCGGECVWYLNSVQMQMRMFKADQERGQRAEVEAIELKRKLETLQR